MQNKSGVNDSFHLHWTVEVLKEANVLRVSDSYKEKNTEWWNRHTLMVHLRTWLEQHHIKVQNNHLQADTFVTVKITVRNAAARWNVLSAEHVILSHIWCLCTEKRWSPSDKEELTLHNTGFSDSVILYFLVNLSSTFVNDLMWCAPPLWNSDLIKMQHFDQIP